MKRYILLAAMLVCLCRVSGAQMGVDDHSTYNPAPQQDQSSDNGEDNRSCNEHDLRCHLPILVHVASDELKPTRIIEKRQA